MLQKPVIVWFRQDLRLSDNPALYYASKTKQPMLFLYIFDSSQKDWSMGEASRWWLHQSLTNLECSLSARGAQLVFRSGDPLQIILEIVKNSQATAIFWNRCYEPYAIARDQKITSTLKTRGFNVNSYNGALLHEPWEYQNQAKQPFKIFTPFWKNCQKKEIREIFSTPKKILPYSRIASLKLSQLGLVPKIPWYKTIIEHWNPGEQYAKKRLTYFLNNRIRSYRIFRDFPAHEHTSRLSPHLHFGEISPVQIWHISMHQLGLKPSLSTDIQHFLSEIAWREFSYHVLYYFPELPNKALNTAFSHFEWQRNSILLKKWQQGLTGYPIVDAGMRELWQTGWMHNRVRMICASFLIKNLLQPWQTGERWFWDTLVDADLANNATSWQWIAGCGTDAAPYFRIFNPILQGKKFDKDGRYVKKWVPELTQLPCRYIHEPWEASKNILTRSHINLGETYPYPIVDLKQSRKRALDIYLKLHYLAKKKQPSRN